MINNPKQGLTFGLFDTIYNAVLISGITIFVFNYLEKYKDGFFNVGLYQELIIVVAVLSAILTFLEVTSIWTKNREKFFELGK